MAIDSRDGANQKHRSQFPPHRSMHHMNGNPVPGDLLRSDALQKLRCMDWQWTRQISLVQWWLAKQGLHGGDNCQMTKRFWLDAMIEKKNKKNMDSMEGKNQGVPMVKDTLSTITSVTQSGMPDLRNISLLRTALFRKIPQVRKLQWLQVNS